MFEVYNDLVWVTLCRLQGPLNLSFRGAGAYNRLTRPAPPKGAIGDTAAARTHEAAVTPTAPPARRRGGHQRTALPT